MDFRVPDLRDICIERCEDALLGCILDCNNDVECLSECIRIETECTSSKFDFSTMKSDS